MKAKILLIPLTLVHLGASAASFDCVKAKSYAEHLICDDPELSRQDDALSDQFKRARGAAQDSKEFGAEAKAEWLRREQCRDKECVTTWFDGRRAQLALWGAESAIEEDKAVKAPDPLVALSTLDDSRSKVWFDQTFKTKSGQTYYVVFAKAQVLDDAGRPEDCHACGNSIGAVTYSLVSGQWQHVATQRGITKLGSWGEAPKVTHGDPIALSHDTTALLVDGIGEGQGYTNRYKSILAFHIGQWRDLGSLEISGDNAGDCDHDKSANLKTLERRACWSYTGSVSTAQGASPQYVDIVVKHAGNIGTISGSKPGEVVAAPTVTYAFDGAAYKEIESPKSALVDRTTASVIEQPTQRPTEKESGVDRFVDRAKTVGLVILAVALLFYFLPSIVAYSRGHNSKNAVLALNLLLGWTLIGWVVAFVWAYTNEAKTVVIYKSASDRVAALEQLTKLKESGAVTQQEFETEKRRILTSA